MLKLFLVLSVFIVLVKEMESAPSPHKNKNDPYKPLIKLLKELRKQRKYNHKYGNGGGSHFGGFRESDDDSEESWEENPFQFSEFSSRPDFGSNKRPSIFPSGGSGGGRDASNLPLPSGNNNAGGTGGNQDPLEQINRGLNNVLQNLGQLTLAQLVQG